jgi:hypothetical protein
VERAFVGLAIVAAVIGGVAAWEAWGGGKMYWTDAGSSKLQRANLDGTSVEDLIITYSSGPMSGGGQRYGIALETAR